MKKRLLVLSAFILPFLLNGCDDDEDYLNQTEATLIKQCRNQTENTQISCGSAYANTIHMARDVFAHTGRNGNPADQPFSGQGLTFIIEDKSFKERHPEMKSMNEFWHGYTGKWLYDAPQGSTTDEVKKVDNQYVLSPQLYDELISAVKTCNRATVNAMQFGQGSTLSPEEYNKVMSIILDCKKFQLDQAVNQK